MVARGGMVAPGGCAWLLQGVCGCSRGGAWLLQGACMVARGGMCGCSGGMHGCSGACVVAPGGACMGYDEIRRYSQ